MSVRLFLENALKIWVGHDFGEYGNNQFKINPVFDSDNIYIFSILFLLDFEE